MTSPVSLFARLKIISSTLFWAFLLIIFLLGLPVLLAISPKVAAGFAATALVLAIIITWLIRLTIYTQSIRPFFFVLAKPFLFLLFILVGLATLPVYYFAYKAETAPLLLPRAEISNGEKTIVFQGMIHIGNENFYKSVNYDLENALADGYKLFYEGVKPSTPEADTWFANTVAGNDTSEKYKEITKACGINFQTEYFQSMLPNMEKNPEQHLIADVDTSQLKNEYDRLMRDDNAFAFTVKLAENEPNKNPLVHYFGDIINATRRVTEGPQRIADTVCNGTFAIMLNPRRLSDGPLNKLILDFRNKHLANAILAEPNNKIYIAYGPAHLPGVLALLREADPRWELKTVTWLRGVTNPESEKGNLQIPGIDIAPEN